MVYEAVEAIALKGQLLRRESNKQSSARSQQQHPVVKEEVEKEELGWAIVVLWIIMKICPTPF